jgi:hypothetical protein
MLNRWKFWNYLELNVCLTFLYHDYVVWFVFMVFYAIFNNISFISWRSVLLVEETVGPGENHRPVASHRQTLSHNVVHLALIEIRTHNISGDRHYHTITTTTASTIVRWKSLKSVVYLLHTHILLLWLWLIKSISSCCSGLLTVKGKNSGTLLKFHLPEKLNFHDFSN